MPCSLCRVDIDNPMQGAVADVWLMEATRLCEPPMGGTWHSITQEFRVRYELLRNHTNMGDEKRAVCARHKKVG